MKRASLITLLLCVSLVGQAFAVSGISVVTHNGTGTLQYYGIQKGELVRNIIVNNEVTSEVIFDGPCTRPAICPSGTHVAFLKGSKVCVIPMVGGDVTELADATENSYLDFPTDDWVYFNMGSFHDDGSKSIKKVKADGSSGAEDVVYCNWRAAQFNISNDLQTVCYRTGDPTGKIVITSPTDGSNYEDRSGGSQWSCASGLFADGQHLMDGWQDGVQGLTHGGMDIRKCSDGSTAKSYANLTALDWAPNSGAWKPANGGHSHAIFHSCGATNSDRWACTVVGNKDMEGRDYINQGQMLVNWKDEECIVPTKDMTGTFDHGDFWDGNPDGVLARPRQTYDVRFVNSILQKQGMWMIDVASGEHQIDITTPTGRMMRAFRGTGMTTYRIDTAGWARGVYCIRVTTSKGAQTQTLALR
ncbi:MAG: hypothetical protein GF418_07870 [Chitinivibrionales bacterium]|nr:hypothetical protein [Chitinivibrionales bacterium]MBD3395529.1 hypothetical protein [Chitinivibrionales bacterium]